MELCYDIYKLIINSLNYEKYPCLRLVCKDWMQYIETTDFQKVLQLIRIINSPPNLLKDPVDVICHVDGTFIINCGWYTYKNGSIIDAYIPDYQKIQEVNNKFGKLELYYSNGSIYIKLNGITSEPIHTGYYLPRFIRTDNEIHLMIGYCYYKYENNQFILCPDKTLQSFSTHRTFDIDYEIMSIKNKIILVKNGIKLGVISLDNFTKNICGFAIGHNYFFIKTSMGTYFWDFPH